MSELSQLFYLHGIGYEFTKYTGEQVFFSEQTRKRALQCCGIDTSDYDKIAQLNYELDVHQWLTLVPEVSLIEQSSFILSLKIAQKQQHLSVNVSITSLQLSFDFNDMHGLQITGEYYIDGERYIEVALPLGEIPTGYHDAVVKVGEQLAATQIWSVPKQVYQVNDKKKTGLSIQLYTLKNAAGLGVGDFGDLLTLTQLCHAHKLDYILLNPLHLLFSDKPEQASPYSPNSRSLLNPLYISIDLSEDSKNNVELNQLMQSDEVKHIKQSNDQFINYARVSEIKYLLFESLYRHFKSMASAKRRKEFDSFCIQHQGTLETLESKQPEFDFYLQWQAHLQLAQCQKNCITLGMSIGLISDLAVGCAGEGVEFKNQRSLFAKGANVGAPPDPWAEGGQNWGLPALNPKSLSSHHYRYYRALIRENMQNVGGLRIDHVMAIRRLWWCFENNGTQDGCYVYYPFEHLLAILKIESHINQSIVIGEDLGIVPPEVREALASSGIFSNSLFYFEKNHEGEFRSIGELPKHCLLMIANHDVPPFTGWWQHDDLTIKQQYKLIDSQQLADLKEQRREEQARLLRFINLSAGQTLDSQSDSMQVYSALSLCLSQSQAQLFAIQIDDLDSQQYPVNIPGTDKEYPNWRRVLSHSCEEIFSKNAALLASIDLKRKG